MDVQSWAEALTAEVDRTWQEHSGLKAGYAVFYSPVRLNPDVLIVGLNPGGDENSFDRASAIKIPSSHEYLTADYPMAVKVRKLFEDIGYRSALESSVKLNLLFFRTRNIQDWRKIEPAVRDPLEKFCKTKVVEIVRTLRPRIVMAEGIEVYTALKSLLIPEDPEPVMNESRKKMFLITPAREFSLIGVPHPTGSFGLSAADWTIIKSNLAAALKQSGLLRAV